MSAGRRVAGRRSTLAVWTLCPAYAVAGVTMVAWRGADVVRGLGVCAVFLAATAAVEAAVAARARHRDGSQSMTGAATLVQLCVAAIVVVGLLTAVALSSGAGQRLGWALGWSAASLPLLALAQLTRSGQAKGTDR